MIQKIIQTLKLELILKLKISYYYIMILALLLFLPLLTTPTSFDNLFQISPLRLTLTSKNKQLEIPKLHTCSCKLLVFPVYDDTYNLTIQSLDNQYNFVTVKVKSSGHCTLLPLDQSKRQQKEINQIRYNSEELTQQYFVKFSKDEQGGSCQGIEEEGELRMAYLVNRTRENEEGQYHYVINLPQRALIITQVLSLVALVVLCQNIKYRRFTPFRFNWIFSIFYSTFLFVTIYIQTYIEDDLQITFWVIMVFSLVSLFLYFIDVTSICLDHTKAILAISLFLALTIGILDVIVLPDAWFINNLIGILVAGALIKFIVIKSLKSAVGPLMFLWLFFILRQFAVLAHLQNFEQVLQIKIVPLFLQLPAMLGDDQQGYLCSAFGTSKIITMGLLLNFSVRIDLFLSNKFYSGITTSLATLCLLIEGLIQILDDEIPVMEYTSVIIFIPLTLIVLLLLASKRGEWAELWHGSFHDMAVDRKSIKKESTILDDQEIDKYLNPLKMNPTILAQ